MLLYNCGRVGGVKARLKDLLAKASIIQNEPIFSLYTCRHVQLKFHVEIQLTRNLTIKCFFNIDLVYHKTTYKCPFTSLPYNAVQTNINFIMF